MCYRRRIPILQLLLIFLCSVCIYIYMLPPPKIYLLHPFVSQISTRKLFAQSKRKTEKKKKLKKPKKITEKQKDKTKDSGETLAETFPSGFWFFWYFCFFWLFRLLRKYFWKNTFHYRPLAFTIFVRKRLFPKDFRQIILNFKLLSLKTGLFQRAVAFFLWRPDFFKGK